MSSHYSRSQIRLARAFSPWRLAAVVAAVATAFALTGCDPGHDVSYENETNEFIEIYVNDFLNVSLEPLQKKKFLEIEFGSATYEARDLAGRVLYRQTFTWDELRDAGWRIGVTDTSRIDPQPAPRVKATPTTLPP